MTLALIVCICVFHSASASSASSGAARPWMQAAGQQTPPAQSPESGAESSQSNLGSSQNPPASGPQTTTAAPAAESEQQKPAATKMSPQQNAKGKHRRHKKTSKTENASDCATSNSAAANASAAEPAAGPDATAASKAPTKCPPPKTVVHDGGTTEPAIQLVGGAGGQNAAGQRSTTDQLVGSTEENLKKIAGRQLDSNQQEMLKQIQQFLDQSRAAVAAGDIERGHNLAMKAHLLSDELAKP